jgi:hypothetical protein
VSRTTDAPSIGLNTSWGSTPRKASCRAVTLGNFCVYLCPTRTTPEIAKQQSRHHASRTRPMVSASGDSRKRQSLDEQSFDDTDLFSGILTGTAGVQLPGSNPMFPAMPFAMLEACSLAGSENPRLAAYCTNFLQNFLAIPLYWCHRLLPIRGTKAEAFRDFIEYLGLDDTHVKSMMKEQPDAKVAIAKLEYIIRVSQPPLIAYCVIASLIIALCLGALVMGSMVDVEYGSFALWDFVNRVETHVRYNGQLNDTGTVAADLEACGNKRSDFEGSTSQIRPDARHAEHI